MTILARRTWSFGIYDWVLAWDHGTSRAWLISTGLPETSPAARAVALPSALPLFASACGRQSTDAGSRPRVPQTRSVRLVPRQRPRIPSIASRWTSRFGLRSSFTQAGYLDAVARVREYIFAGDIFQANLSQRFEAPLCEPTWAFYRRLRTRNAAPFAAYLDFPETVVLSASPERFLSVDVDGRVETRPIKGTRPRGLGPSMTPRLAQALTESAKDRAENLMIVDLMRNDLSRVCAPGTVRVPELFALERYATVHHLVSTVVGTLAPNVDRTRSSCALLFQAARSPARPSFVRWRSLPSSSRLSAESIAAQSVTGV